MHTYIEIFSIPHMLRRVCLHFPKKMLITLRCYRQQIGRICQKTSVWLAFFLGYMKNQLEIFQTDLWIKELKKLSSYSTSNPLGNKHLELKRFIFSLKLQLNNTFTGLHHT